MSRIFRQTTDSKDKCSIPKITKTKPCRESTLRSRCSKTRPDSVSASMTWWAEHPPQTRAAISRRWRAISPSNLWSTPATLSTSTELTGISTSMLSLAAQIWPPSQTLSPWRLRLKKRRTSKRSTKSSCKDRLKSGISSERKKSIGRRRALTLAIVRSKVHSRIRTNRTRRLRFRAIIRCRGATQDEQIKASLFIPMIRLFISITIKLRTTITRNSILRGPSRTFLTSRLGVRSSRTGLTWSWRGRATFWRMVEMRKLCFKRRKSRSRMQWGKHFRNKLRKNRGRRSLIMRKWSRRRLGTISGSEMRWNRWP